MVTIPKIDSDLMFAGWTQAQLEDAIFELENAILTGASDTSSSDGTRTSFRSVDDMARILNRAKAALAAVTGDTAMMRRPVGRLRQARRWRPGGIRTA